VSQSSVLRAFSTHRLVVRGGNRPGDRSRFAIAHETIVYRRERHDFDGSTSHERFVGQVEIVAAKSFETHLVAQVVGDLHDAGLGDPAQSAGL